MNSEEPVPAGSEAGDFSIRNGPFEHPESTVRMDELDAVFPEQAGGFFEALSDLIGTFDMVDFDVDHPETEPDVWLDIPESVEIIFWPVS